MDEMPHERGDIPVSRRGLVIGATLAGVPIVPADAIAQAPAWRAAWR
jgi:hypothetical protein